MDRCRTVVNVTGDTVVCDMVSHMCAVDEADAMMETTGAGTNVKSLQIQDSSSSLDDVDLQSEISEAEA